MPHVNVIIAAGGSSLRYGKENKLLEPCRSTCVLVEAIKPFLSFGKVKRVIVAVDSDSADEFLDKLEAAHLDEDTRVILTRGGKSRTSTATFGLAALDDECDVVLVHDGARPYASASLISAVIDGAVSHGACVPVLPLTDNILRTEGDEVFAADRTPFRRVQTPAGFERKRLQEAYDACTRDYLDDISVVEAHRHGKIKLVEGERSNVKITVKEDLKTSLVGCGYDIHRLKDGDGIRLLGEKIPCPYSFVAHSDGDVAIHALMDAVLSALGKKDIGHLYPVDDPKYDGADSVELLDGVLNIMRSEHRSVANCSVAIIAEKPVLAPYIDRMRTRMSRILDVPAQNMGITATTNESVGDIGEGNAIAAYVTVLLV